MPYKRGKRWEAQVYYQGRKYRKMFPTRAEAIAWEVAQRQKLRTATCASSMIPTISLGDWAIRYLDYAKVKFSRKTYDEKRCVFRRFFQVISPELPVTSLTPGMVLSYLQGQADTRSGYAANKERKNLLAAWNWGIKYLGLPSPNPCLVDRFPEQRQVRYVPPERDFWAVYDQAEGQDAVMLLAYLHLAARRSELFALRWDDVDFSGRRVRLYTRKRRDGTLEFDWLPMTDDLFHALLAHRETATTEWVFPDPTTGKPYQYRLHFMRRLCRRAGVKPFGFHAIRHLTASILAKANVPMVDIQRILRHKNLATTERYIRRLDDLRAALKVLPRSNHPHITHNQAVVVPFSERKKAANSSN